MASELGGKEDVQTTAPIVQDSLNANSKKTATRLNLTRTKFPEHVIEMRSKRKNARRGPARKRSKQDRLPCYPAFRSFGFERPNLHVLIVGEMDFSFAMDCSNYRRQGLYFTASTFFDETTIPKKIKRLFRNSIRVLKKRGVCVRLSPLFVSSASVHIDLTDKPRFVDHRCKQMWTPQNWMITATSIRTRPRSTMNRKITPGLSRPLNQIASAHHRPSKYCTTRSYFASLVAALSVEFVVRTTICFRVSFEAGQKYLVQPGRIVLH